MTFDNRLDAVRAYDNVHWIHPWENLGAAGQQNRTIVTGGEGIYIRDENGRKLIDGPGGMWCVQIGYGNREMADAIYEQVMKMAYNNPFGTTSEPAALLARKMAELAPGDLDHVFFATGGSTAVDSAVRFVHFYNNMKGRPQKKLIISRADSYHGSTYVGASISGKVGNKGQFDHDTTIVDFVGTTNPYRRPAGMSVEAFADACVAELERKILEHGPDRVGGFIAEPIQASGGVIVAPDGYLRRARELCTKYDIIYISDEVVTGFGRCGHWFASKDMFGIEPDIITCAKGLTSGYLPLGAFILSKRLYAEVTGENAKSNWFSNGFTYSGHPVSCAAALKNIEIIERTGLLDHVRKITPKFQARLQAMRKLPIVGDVRGAGLVGCIECVASKDDTDPWNPKYPIGKVIDAHCIPRGLLVRPILNMCVFSPPLIITEDEIDRMFDIMEEGVKAAMDQMVREGQWRG